MITFDVISIMPQMFEVIKSDGVVSRALKDSKVNLNLWNPRDYVNDVHHTIDDRPYGGGPGMVMMIEPLVKTIRDIKKNHENKKVHNSKVIYLSPKGKRLDQKKLIELSKIDNMILISGRYEGIDQRVRDTIVTREISIGDYVLSGGELPAAVLCDSIVRLIPGVLNDETSALTDSFQDNLLAPPVYTRPANYNGMKVPEILLSGNRKKIEEWREEKSVIKTKAIRPDLID